MAVYLPIDWDGVIPDDGTPFSEWVVTGTIIAELPVAFDPAVEDAPLTINVDTFTDIESGLALDSSYVTSKACGNGVFVLRALIRDGGAYIKAHPNADTDSEVEGILTATRATEAADIREALGLTTATLSYTLSTILSSAQTAAGRIPLNAAGIRDAVGLLDDDLDAQLLAIRNSLVAGSAGDILFTWTEYEEGHAGDVNHAIADVTVHAFANEAATGLMLGTAITDELGQAKMYLNAGTYYLFRRKAGREFLNPVRVTVSPASGDEVAPPPLGYLEFAWYEYEDGHDGDPAYGIDLVVVSLFGNVGGTGAPIDVQTTDADGLATFDVAPGTYYLFRSKPGRTFTNPVTIDVS